MLYAISMMVKNRFSHSTQHSVIVTCLFENRGFFRIDTSHRTSNDLRRTSQINLVLQRTDRFNIDSADAAALQSQAQYLARYPRIRITVEGHADERGTREYNLALGERRANATKNYLVGLGVAANRIATVSYGKERPVALGSNERAWAQNRRAVSVVIN